MIILQKETELCKALRAFEDHSHSWIAHCAGNVFGVVPNNAARDVSIILMVIHEVCPSSGCLRWCEAI